MAKRSNIAPWHALYRKLAQLLSDFAKKCEDKGLVPGEELYKKCINDKEYKENNSWINKFEQEFGVKSLDPFHFFCSISANKLTKKKRLNRIRIFFRVLWDVEFDSDVNFDGCPTPAPIKLLGARKKEHQLEIWELFKKVQKTGRKGITANDFANYEKWYGIEFSSFTTFLFWIDSDNFLPIERNVRTFLGAIGHSDHPPTNYNTFLSLLKLLDQFNYRENEIYDQSGIFRELTHLSYQIITEQKKDITYSESLSNFLKSKSEVHFASSGSFKKKTSIKKVNDVDAKLPITSNDITEVSKLGFKLIAIRPLKKCNQDYLNVLNKNEIYYFEKTVSVNEEFIEYFPERNLNLYSNKVIDKNELFINVTAIVGRNGSGKSSLIELLFRAINNIAFSQKRSLRTKGLKLIESLNLELYYIHSGYLYKIVIDDDSVKIQEYILVKNKFVQNWPLRDLKPKDLECFFYSIGVNYSLYGLNSNKMGKWLEAIFIKNDGYQTPLVINPMRIEGNVDINIENDLVNSRLIANLLAPIENAQDIGIRQITEKQKADYIEYSLIHEKNKILFTRRDGMKVPFTKLKGNRTKILDIVKEVFGVKEKARFNNNKIVDEIKKYIIGKLVRISVTYPEFHDYFDQKLVKFKSLNSLKEYLELLRDEPSHIAYKLKQSINYWKHPELWGRSETFKVDINSESVRLENFMSLNEYKEISECIPPPIFFPEVWLKNIDGSVVPFHKLSSGEKQLIHSTSSLLYHIKNLDSIPFGKRKTTYGVINIMLDEIELYYHPELQRGYVDYLISAIRKIELQKIDGINICLVTHSPYILSDISDNFILKVGDSPELNEGVRTFGANIHNLLANDFFMRKGFMGEWAKKKIDETIKYLSYLTLKKDISSILKGNGLNSAKRKVLELELKLLIESRLSLSVDKIDKDEHSIEKLFESKDYYQQLIELIGEPVIKVKLQSMYNEHFPDNKGFSSDEKRNLLRKLAGELGVKVIEP